MEDEENSAIPLDWGPASGIQREIWPFAFMSGYSKAVGVINTVGRGEEGGRVARNSMSLKSLACSDMISPRYCFPLLSLSSSSLSSKTMGLSPPAAPCISRLTNRSLTPPFFADSGAPSYLSAFITIPLLWYPTPGLPKPITFAYAGFNAFAGIMASYDYPLDGALTTFSWSLLYALTNGSRKVWRLMLEEQRGRDLPRVKYAGMWAYGSGQRAVGGTGLKGLGVTTYRWGCVVSVLNVVWGAGAGWYWWGGRKRGDKDRVWEDGIQDKWA